MMKIPSIEHSFCDVFELVGHECKSCACAYQGHISYLWAPQSFIHSPQAWANRLEFSELNSLATALKYTNETEYYVKFTAQTTQLDYSKKKFHPFEMRRFIDTIIFFGWHNLHLRYLVAGSTNYDGSASTDGKSETIDKIITVQKRSCIFKWIRRIDIAYAHTDTVTTRMRCRV